MGLVAHPWIVTPEPRSIPRCVGLTEDLETHVGRYFPACNRIATVVLQTRGGQTSFPKQEDSHMHIVSFCSNRSGGCGSYKANGSSFGTAKLHRLT